MKKYLLLAMILILGIFPAFSAYNRLSIPDSAELRTNLIEKWFEASLTVVRNNPPEILVNQAGNKFQVRLEENEDTFNIFVAPHSVINVDVYSDKGVETIEQDVYPGDAPGSFVLVRDKKSGKPIRVRYYFSKDSDVYVQFSPNGKVALADLLVYGNYAARGVATGIPFSKFYTTSIEDILVYTDTKLPWEYVTPEVNMYHSILQMIAVIDEKLPQISFEADAMYNENGELVHISNGKKYENSEKNNEKLSLSSAGFVKWIADGLVEPISGGLLKREPLVQETVSVKENGRQGVLSQKYDLFFSLNWIRNLASAVMSVYSGTTYLFNQSGVDVNINPFASTISPEGVANIVAFIEDTGYSVSVLKSLLYIMASTNPGTFYFGAIRETDRTVSPEIKVFNECAAFFPYFKDDGVFACTVFMNGRKMALEDFCVRYSEDFVYLTKIRSSEQFFPN